MDKDFKSINFPPTLKVSSTGGMIPLDFFGEVMPRSKKIQFKLGYFSSNSISTLSYGFAQFIYNGGTIDFLINHFVNENDYKLINDKYELDQAFYDSIEQIILNDLKKLQDILTKKQVSHFYNCLRYLIETNRVTIIPVTTKSGEISHYKEALFWDANDDVINIVGSCNFTYKGIVCNGESFVIDRSWGEVSERANIRTEIDDYKRIFTKESNDFIYLNPKNLIKIIREKSISLDQKQLLENEFDLVSFNGKIKDVDKDKIKKVNLKLRKKFEKAVKEYINIPKFPFDQPRKYQIEAFLAWKENDCKGIFAMATGTGKTITSLNCVVEEFKKTKEYTVIITVPTVTLVNQWVNEAKKFNFKNIISTTKYKDWDSELRRFLFNKEHSIGNNHNFIFITTYATFNKQKCQKLIKKLNHKNTILIADEVHNFGAPTSLKNLPFGINKRIGLSATPERIYDEVGSLKLYEYFNSFPPLYTYKFSMREAIDKGFLTPYYYYPYFVNLEHDELEQYLELTRQLVKFFDFDKGKFRDSATQLLIKRKRIIHKARNKKECLKMIFQDVSLNSKSLKYTFVYVPEGYEPNNNLVEENEIEDEDIRIINEYSKIINGFGYKTYQFLGETKNREKILKQFKNGELEILTAMKALDEGVDIPITKNAIFCASTGNPRQFIQRRGRVLRVYEGKEYANIYDMIVTPSVDLMINEDPELKDMEIRIFKGELKRVANFLYSSENMMEVINDKIREVAEKYNLDIFELINKNIENDKLKK